MLTVLANENKTRDGYEYKCSDVPADQVTVLVRDARNPQADPYVMTLDQLLKEICKTQTGGVGATVETVQAMVDDSAENHENSPTAHKGLFDSVRRDVTNLKLDLNGRMKPWSERVNTRLGSAEAEMTTLKETLRQRFETWAEGVDDLSGDLAGIKDSMAQKADPAQIASQVASLEAKINRLQSAKDADQDADIAAAKSDAAGAKSTAGSALATAQRALNVANQAIDKLNSYKLVTFADPAKINTQIAHQAVDPVWLLEYLKSAGY